MDCDDQPGQASVGSCCALVKQDITHVQVLLQDAVDKLLLETLAMRRECDAQHMAAVRAHVADPCEQVQDLSRMITERTNATLLHLQFQDMVTQVLDHVKNGLDELEALTLAVAADCPPSGGCRRSKPVNSRDMRAGDIELF